MQDRMEIDRNPGEEIGFPVPGMNAMVPEAETNEPTRASSRLKKKSTLNLTYKEIAALKGEAFAQELFELAEAATTYHPEPENIRAALAAIRGNDQPSEAAMRLAGPALVTWLRDKQGRSSDAFRFWVRSHYPKDYEEGRSEIGKARVRGGYQRVSPYLAIELRQKGLKRCPRCKTPKPISDFRGKSGTMSSYCFVCRHAPVRQQMEAKETV